MPKIFSDADRAAIRAKLLQAGQQELQHKSYRRVAVEDLTARAGIAKGTFYHFFPSKEAFFYELMHQIKQQNRSGLLELLENGTPDREALIDCLFRRYTCMKSVYEYFPPADLEAILAKIPPEQQRTDDDSVAFAALAGSRIRPLTREEAQTIVGMFNILGLAAAGHRAMDITGYEPAMRAFCAAAADMILGGTP